MNLITREIFFEISIENLQKIYRKSSDISSDIVQKLYRNRENISKISIANLQKKQTENLQKYIEINVRK